MVVGVSVVNVLNCNIVISKFELKSHCDLFDILHCQNMAQDCFMVGATYELRLVCSRCKNS